MQEPLASAAANASLRRLAGRGLVQADGSSDEGRKRLLIDLIALVEVDRAPGVAVEARVEQSRGVVERGALEECEFHDALVRLAGADQALVRPHRNPWIGSLFPLPLLDRVGVGLSDQSAKRGEGRAPPVTQFVDPCVYQLRWRLDLLPGALRHGLRRYRREPCSGGTLVRTSS